MTCCEIQLCPGALGTPCNSSDRREPLTESARIRSYAERTEDRIMSNENHIASDEA